MTATSGDFVQEVVGFRKGDNEPSSTAYLEEAAEDIQSVFFISRVEHEVIETGFHVFF